MDLQLGLCTGGHRTRCSERGSHRGQDAGVVLNVTIRKEKDMRKFKGIAENNAANAQVGANKPTSLSVKSKSRMCRSIIFSLRFSKCCFPAGGGIEKIAG